MANLFDPALLFPNTGYVPLGFGPMPRPALGEPQLPRPGTPGTQQEQPRRFPRLMDFAGRNSDALLNMAAGFLAPARSTGQAFGNAFAGAAAGRTSDRERTAAEAAAAEREAAQQARNEALTAWLQTPEAAALTPAERQFLLTDPDASAALVQAQITRRMTPASGDPFTLGPGESRFGPNGEVLASVPPNAGSGPTPYTEVARIQSDLNAGYLTPEQATAAIAATQDPAAAPPSRTAFNPATGQEEFQEYGPNGWQFTGTAAEAPVTDVLEPPTIQSFYDEETGLSYRAQWNPETGTWDRIGGVEAPNGMTTAIGPDGSVTITQGPLAAGGRPTDANLAANLYATRMADAHAIITELEEVGTSLGQRALSAIPVMGNYLISPEMQQFEQAQRNFINAVLRRESGAVISADEFANARQQYFPQPGDGPEVIEQKRQNREAAIAGIAQAAGPAYSAPQPAASAPTSVYVWTPDQGLVPR